MSIIDLDKEIILTINSWHNDFFDNFMWNYSQKWTWLGLYILLIGYLIYTHRKNSIWLFLAIGAAFGLADWGSHELKHIFMRFRPAQDPDIASMIHIVNDYRGGKFGFPSSHACDSFALATLVSLINRDKIVTTTMVLWATLNAYSRMYLGVHYLGDILTGMLLGILIATICYLPLYYTKKSEPIAQQTNREKARWSLPTMWILTMIVICFI